MELTIFDWIVLFIVGLSGLLALFRGFIREVLSLTAWLTAAVVTFNYYSSVAALLASRIPNEKIALGVAVIGTYIGVLLVMAILNTVIMRFLHAGGEISVLDSLLGMVFGALRGLFVVSLGFLMLTVVMTEEEYPEDIKNARTLPFVEASARFLAELAPNYVNDLSLMSQEAKEKGEQIQEMKKQMDDVDKALGGKKDGYGTDQRQDLDRLLDSIQREGNALEK